jgi:adenine-specific DNA-methyltransferase
MCSVAGALATNRNAWCNDVQQYAVLVADRLVCARSEGMRAADAATALFPHFVRNRNALAKRFASAVAAEEAALRTDSVALEALERTWLHVGNDDLLRAEADRLRLKPTTFPYRLATITFAHGYFGVRQAMDLDSLRFAIEASPILTNDERKWALVALLQTCSKAANAPGHFAQFLHTRDAATFIRVRRARQRGIWEQFLTDLEAITPYGTAAWRAGNRSFCSDALVLARNLRRRHDRPAAVYADPPYTKDQYSRYYHVLETMFRYDYPRADGCGRYRPGRFQTPFSRVSEVAGAFETLAAGVAGAGAALVVSYPSNGLLLDANTDVPSILKGYYRRVSVRSVPYRHSTLGARHGQQKSDVHEHIYVGRDPL